MTLPKGWVKAKLSEFTLERIEQGEPGRSAVPYIDIGSIDRDLKRVGPTKKITGANAPTRARQWVKPGDVLVSLTRPNLNAVAVVSPELGGAVASTGFDVLRPTGVLPDWVFNRVRSQAFVSDMCEGVQGVVYPAIRPADVRRHELPIPPAQEQRRIVDAIDCYLTRLDDAVASLERVQTKLKAYRASVLKAAVEGCLVPTEASLARAEKRAYESAEALLARILKERRRRWEEAQLAKLRAAGKTPTDDKWKAKYEEPLAPDTSKLPEPREGWCWASVDQLSVVVRGASPRPAGDPRYFGGSVPWITVGSLTADEEPYLRQVSESLTEAGRRASRFVEAGTLLLTNSGATLGVPKITLIGGCINDGSVALLHVHDPTKLYLYFFLKTLTQNLRSINQGAAQPNLNTGIVRNIAVSVPPITEQSRIGTELERLLSVVTAIEADVVAGRKRALRLRHAVLKWAFEGKLVDQDQSDEPADKLLARIRNERAVVVPAKKSQGRRAEGAA